jgi:hypothetical protein
VEWEEQVALFADQSVENLEREFKKRLYPRPSPPEEALLIRAVLSSPEERVVKGVLADWYQERNRSPEETLLRNLIQTEERTPTGGCDLFSYTCGEFLQTPKALAEGGCRSCRGYGKTLLLREATFESLRLLLYRLESL